MTRRKMLALLLALLICSPAAGFAEAEPFALTDGLTWSTGPAEAARMLGEGAEFQEDTDEDIGKLGLVVKDDLEYAGLDCGRATLIYYNDAMVYATFYFTEAVAGADMAGLMDVARERFGTPAYEGESREDDLPEALGGMQIACRWTPDAQTQVSVLEITEADYPYRCALFFENLPVEEQLKIAMEVE